MSGRIRYLVAYDIRDDRRLRTVAKIMVGFGSRLQYSVFVCDLTYAELCDMRLSLGSVVQHREDSVVIIPLGEGYDVSAFEFIGPAPPLPKAGSTIV
ncbi:MAG: CRISPR-associated endonuclease Cas2 [Microthrixaceae bacterium]